MAPEPPADDPGDPMTPRSLLPLATALCALLIAVPAGAADRERPAGRPMLGKYGCSESVFSLDGYHSEARGFITLLPGGRYRQGTGAIGRYRYHAKSGVTTFKGGGIDGSKATGIDGKRNRLFIMVKLKSGRPHWACTRTGKG
ncbi:MAG TPA: hypothetical protein VFT50_14815 [Baekduia sp.]|nr:hypothetical protein [Baekduia sp.]